MSFSRLDTTRESERSTSDDMQTTEDKSNDGKFAQGDPETMNAGVNIHVLRSTCAQVLATLIQNWLLIDIGMTLAMPTLVLAALHNKPAEKLNMNNDQASWYGSLSSFVHPIGSLTSGFLQDQFGRKGCMIIINIPIFIGWLILYLAESIYAFYIVSIIMGLCGGLCEASLHSYIGEIGEPRLRGTLSTLSTSACSVGCIFMYVLGYMVDWRTAALISCAIPVITLICMTQIPESPTWLIAHHRLEDAKKSLSWLRGWAKKERTHEEFENLIKFVKNSESNQTDQENETVESFGRRNDGYLKRKLKEVTDKKVLLPLRLVFIVFIVTYVTALIGLQPYMDEIYKKFELPIDSKLILIINQVIYFSGAMGNAAILRRFGKRKIALLAQGMATACICVLGVHCSFFLHDVDKSSGNVWVPFILMAILTFFSGFSVVLLPWQLVCEIFPLVGRGFAGGIAAAWAQFVIFAVSKSYLYLEEWITFSGVMCVYGVIALLGWLYFFFYLPETEGKSLEQIETYFTKEHDRKEKFSIGRPV